MSIRLSEPIATTTIRSSGTARFASGYAAMTLRRRCSPTPDPPTETRHTFSCRW